MQCTERGINPEAYARNVSYYWSLLPLLAPAYRGAVQAKINAAFSNNIERDILLIQGQKDNVVGARELFEKALLELMKKPGTVYPPVGMLIMDQLVQGMSAASIIVLGQRRTHDDTYYLTQSGILIQTANRLLVSDGFNPIPPRPQFTRPVTLLQ